MGATILNGAQIGKNCLVGAGALITEGKSIPDGSMVLGMPGKVVKELDEDAINGLLKSAENYQANAVRFMKSLNVIEV
jgi:carbonic anhydrase/acetyltransferase-like protein (isoleucine patch superfamily)